MALEAELVPDRDRRPDDPATRPAGHGGTGGGNDQRSGRQPRDLRLTSGSRRRRHPARCEGGLVLIQRDTLMPRRLAGLRGIGTAPVTPTMQRTVAPGRARDLMPSCRDTARTVAPGAP